MQAFSHSLYYCFLEYQISELIPIISAIIESPNLSDNFKKCYELFYEESIKDEEYWILTGKSGRISVKFEMHESYLHVNIFTISENTKQEVIKSVTTYLHALKK